MLEEQRAIARQLKDSVRDLPPQSATAIAFVAADGGDNRIRLDSTGGGPAIVELVRVVDSNGRECALEAFAGAAEEADFTGRAEPVVRLREALGYKNVADLSPYLTPKSRMSPREKMSEYREIVEWAVLFDLLSNKEWGCDTLLVREGALRTRAFDRAAFEVMDNKIRAACKRHAGGKVNMYFAGVAKQTKLLSRLQLALSLEDVFNREGSCYLHVPRETADKFYTDRRWLDTLETAEGREYNSMAEMYLVKFGDDPLDSVWPVDVAVWQADKAEKILGYLAEDARPGFPIPDFPMCIQKAHDYAKIGGVELAYLNDLLYDEAEKHLPGAAEKLARARYLKEDSVALRYRNE